jgi:hypothetical protein
MQRVLEHLCLNVRHRRPLRVAGFDEPSLIAFPPSLSTTTPQKKARLVTEATFEVSQSSPEARGTAFLGEVLNTIESRHGVKTRWTSPTFVPVDVCLSLSCFPYRVTCPRYHHVLDVLESHSFFVFSLNDQLLHPPSLFAHTRLRI